MRNPWELKTSSGQVASLTAENDGARLSLEDSDYTVVASLSLADIETLRSALGVAAAHLRGLKAKAGDC